MIWFFFGLLVPEFFLENNFPNSEKLSNFSAMGDAFGGANALFSSLALFMLMFSVYLQKTELEETRKEIRASAQAQAEMADQQKKAISLQVIMPFMDEISSEDMRQAIIYLSDMQRKDEEFKSTYANLLFKRKSNTLSQADEAFLNDIDRARRKFVMIFHRMYKLHCTKVVDKEIVKVVIGADHVYLLLTIIEPLESVIRENYAKAIFDFARSLYSDAELTELGRHQ
jgi:hypothetical protein